MAAARSTEPAYGTLPSFLPSDPVRADSVLTGSTTDPALTSEGDAVEVRLGGATLRATVVGPDVPGEGLPYQTATTTCTWTVLLSASTAMVPIRAAQFSAIDHLGNQYPVAAVPGHPLPSGVTPGHRVRFRIRAVMPTGEGLMRWAPDGNHIVAKWDFTVEND